MNGESIKWLGTALVGISLVSSVPSYGETGIAKTPVFVRQAPAKGSPALGAFLKGAPVEFLPVQGKPKWVKVTFMGADAYVFRGALRETERKVAAPHLATRTIAPATEVAPSAIKNASVPTVTVQPSSDKAQVFDIIPENCPEAARLTVVNAKLSAEVKDLEGRLQEVQPLKEEVAHLKAQLVEKDRQIADLRKTFPYIEMIEKVEKTGKEVFINGIGKARMADYQGKVVVRLDSTDFAKGDQVMSKVHRERYLTGSGESARSYYVLSSKSVKNTN